MNYWDTSALIKLYAPEPDSPYFLTLLSRVEGPLLTSDITRAEVLCTLYRKEHAGDLTAGAAAGLFNRFLGDIEAGRIVLIANGLEVTEKAHTLVQRAYSQPQPLLIRSLDAIHAASALTARATTVVATDTRLCEVAKLLLGLTALP